MIGPRTIDNGPRTRKIIGLLFFLFLVHGPWSVVPSPARAQAPSLNLPPVPSETVVVIFKNVTRNDLFRVFTDALKQSKRVENFVMAKAQRGFIEYKGDFFGDSESFLTVMKEAVGDKLNIEMKPKAAGIELLVTSQSP